MAERLHHPRPARPTVIPTAFARLHREIMSCDRVEDLVDAAMRLIPGNWGLSAPAHQWLINAANRRFSELHAQECAA